MVPVILNGDTGLLSGFLWALSVCAGLVIGSFVTTAALRTTQAASAWRGRSRCDHCLHELTWAETVPVLSGLNQKGRCRRCAAKIDPVHLAGELSGVLVVLLGVGLSGWPQNVLVVIMGFLLLALAVIDLKTMRLPDLLVFPVLCVGAVLSVVNGRVWPDLLWAVGTFAVMKVAQKVLRSRLNRPALGSGDVKLMAAVSLWLGAGIVYALLLASLLALIFVGIRRHRGLIPFGPFLTIAAFIIGVQIESPWISAFWARTYGGL